MILTTATDLAARLHKVGTGTIKESSDGHSRGTVSIGLQVQATPRRHAQDLRQSYSDRRHRSPFRKYSSSPDPIRNQRRPLKEVEIRRYNGKDNIEKYLVQFELAARYNCWFQEQKVTALIRALDGSARGILAEVDDSETVTFKELKHVLQKRFSPTDMTEVHEQALSQLRLSKSQSIRELAQEVARLTRKAYPGLGVNQRERFAIKGLLNAISDREVIFYIKNKEPMTLDAACTLYEWYEALSGPDNQRMATARSIKPFKKADENALSDCVIKAVHDDVKKLRTDTQEQLCALTEAVRRLDASAKQSSNERPQSSTISAGGNLPRTPCPQGKAMGHWKRDCPQLRTGSNSRNQCLECGAYGHYWRLCPALPSENGR